MKGHWLRGVLVGVSLALLLVGGVALAQGLFLTVEKECVECWPGEGAPTEDQYLLPYTMGGWDPEYELCQSNRIDGVLVYEGCGGFPPEDPSSGTEWWPCAPLRGSASVLGRDVDVSNGPISPLGEWVVRLWQEIPGEPNPTAQVTFVVAEDCSAYEFVPEPGTLMLLGSGLVGLAGYATLRWRTRQ